MSLTRTLREVPELETRLRALVPDTTQLRLQWADGEEGFQLRYWKDFQGAIPIVAPARTRHYPLIGTALDYLLRFEIGRVNKNAVEETWIADQAVNMMRTLAIHKSANGDRWPGIQPQTEDLTKYREAVDWCHNVIRLYREEPNDHSELPELSKVLIRRAALTMAKVDTFYRSLTIEPDVRANDEGDEADLETLMEIMPGRVLGAVPEGPRVWLNPSFGSISVLFNGADADLIVGDTLVDFKATIHASNFEKYLPQIVGYAIVADRYRTERPDFPQ